MKDIEILHSKIDQLGRSKFRASLVTTHGFQSGALELAKSTGISLFVFKKKLVKVSKFAENAIDWDEMIVLSSGLTGIGRELHDGVWLEMALLRCYRDFQTEQLTTPPGV